MLGGVASDALLATYDQERRDHTKAMIDVSVAMGRLLCPTNKIVGRVRDATAYALDLTPPTKRWIAEMRYKPQPRFRAGALVNAAGPAAAGKPVGQMSPSPRRSAGPRGHPPRRGTRLVVPGTGVGQRPARGLRHRVARHPSPAARSPDQRAPEPDPQTCARTPDLQKQQKCPNWGRSTWRSTGPSRHSRPDAGPPDAPSVRCGELVGAVARHRRRDGGGRWPRWPAGGRCRVRGARRRLRRRQHRPQGRCPSQAARPLPDRDSAGVPRVWRVPMPVSASFPSGHTAFRLCLW